MKNTTKTSLMMLTGIIAIASIMGVSAMSSQDAYAVCSTSYTQSVSFTMTGDDGSATGSTSNSVIVCGETLTISVDADQDAGTITTTWSGPSTLNGSDFSNIHTVISGGWDNRISESDVDNDESGENDESVRSSLMTPNSRIYVDHEWTY